MKWSESFVPTLKEAPREAETISHKLMIRAALVRKLAAGLYTYLPLGLRVIKKIEKIVREELEREGAQELLMPILQPRELWEASGRWEKASGNLGILSLKNREGREFALGPTHEEIITDLVGREIKSYRELPLNLYQIQTKFRDELRPRFGLIRTREFIMKDSYSFDVDNEASEVCYEKMSTAYQRIFRRAGLEVQTVQADSGAMGEGKSEEFMALADIGEDTLATCSKCGWAINQDSLPEKDKASCPKCSEKLSLSKGIEVGQIFNLGEKYSRALGANYLDKEGKEKPMVMGCYGIGISRMVTAIIEQHYDEEGIIWPREVSPYQAHLILLNPEDNQAAKDALRLYQELQGAGIEVFFDDRLERAGIKFKDADLLGFPLRLTISAKRAAEGKVEIKCRRSGQEFVVDKGKAPERAGELMKTA